MSKLWVPALFAIVGASALTLPGSSSGAPVSAQHYTVVAGETYRSIAKAYGLSESALACANATTSTCPSVTSTLAAGRIIHLTPLAGTPATPPPETAASTTAAPTTAASTTAAPTTAAPTTAAQTTAAPTTAASSTTTTMSMSMPMPTTTTAVPPVGGFVEDFTVNGTERLNMGLYRRDNTLIAQTQWQGDHNMACGAPTTTRTILRTDGLAGDVYRCAAPGMDPHLMVSEGDTSGYTIVWLSPQQTFTNVTSVCVDLNLNFGTLGYRQWPSIAVMPVGHTELTANIPAADAGKGVSIYPPATGFAVAEIGSPSGATGKLQINGTRLDFPEIDAKTDSGTRYPMCFTDNRNGTLTFEVTGPDKSSGSIINPSYTRSGSFPTGTVKVVLSFHGYTPLKAGGETGVPVAKNTWHVDNFKVTVG
jgi:LysM domain